MKAWTITTALTGIVSLAAAQTETFVTGTISETASVVQSITGAATSTVPTGQACAVVSSVLAAQSGQPPLVVDASLANECARSAPIVQDDALRLIDGIVAALEFQSNIGHLKDPPAGYLMAGVDLFGEIQGLRNQVSSGQFTSEIDFERNFSAILGKAKDGHLNFAFDGLAVFLYQRLVGGLISVSNDGTSEPVIYLYDEWLAFQNGQIADTSAVTQIDGQDVADFLTNQALNVTYGGFQDPDTLYNSMFYALNAGLGGVISNGVFASGFDYPGDQTSVSFANGSTIPVPNIAIFNNQYDFTGLQSGEDFYYLFCNATAKAAKQGFDLASVSSGEKAVTKQQKERLEHEKREELFRKREVQPQLQKRQDSTHTISVPTTTYGSVTQTATQIQGYPTPIALSDDLTVSGYFLDEVGFDNTAVLVLQAMSLLDPPGAQAAVKTFMDACRRQKKQHLIIDVQGNPGGSVMVGYEVFRQLFPDLYPYGAATLRAHEGLDVLGSFYTNFTSQLLQEEPGNFTALKDANFYMQYSAKAWTNSSGQLFENWKELYGPVETSTDNFTNLIRWDINDTNFNIAQGQFVLSGLANNTDIEPSPFTSDNIIILSDGRCSSTCTILSHFLKYQAKVKSIAMGGRPQTGAMQAIGGTKGSQVYQYSLLYGDIYQAYQYASVLGYKDVMSAIENSKSVGPIFSDANYIILRGANAGLTSDALSDFQFNWQNNIAENDTSYTPLQLVYEAADCRLWFQNSHIYDIRNLWYTVAGQAFGLNSTEVFSLCVQGSTNAPSSLSGNTTLYNNGNPVNVTSFMPEEQGSSGNDNAAERIAVSTASMVVMIIAALLVL